MVYETNKQCSWEFGFGLSDRGFRIFIFKEVLQLYFYVFEYFFFILEFIFH